jgi:hypothetical protein
VVELREWCFSVFIGVLHSECDVWCFWNYDLMRETNIEVTLERDDATTLSMRENDDRRLWHQLDTQLSLSQNKTTGLRWSEVCK